jgi:hypothetical protein
MIQDSIVPVLVNEDTIYRREDHYKRLLLFGRPGQVQTFNSLWPQHEPISVFLSGDPWLEQVASPKSPEAALLPFRQIPVSQPSGQQLSLLTVPRPKPQLFEDRFVSVYPVIEQYSQIATTSFTPNQPQFIYFYNNRPRPEFFDDHSLETGQTNHPFPHVIQIGIGLFPYSFEVADLNSDPWIEWVPLHQAVNMYPFRQIYPVLPPQQIMLQMFYQPPDWHMEAEPLYHVPATNNDLLHQFRWQVVVPILPNVVGLTQLAAITLLNFDGFFNVTVVLLPSATVPAGTVISQLPLPGIVSSFTIPVIINVSLGFQPPGTVIVPNVVGVILREGIQLLTDAGVYVPSAIGYFGTDPITVQWLPVALGRKDGAYIGDFGIIHAQIPPAGSAVVPNSPITLIVSSYPEAVSFQ